MSQGHTFGQLTITEMRIGIAYMTEQIFSDSACCAYHRRRN